MEYLENNLKFNREEALDIAGCVPQLIRVKNAEIHEKFTFIKEFLNMNENDTRQMILKYPSILYKANPEKFKNVELYFKIYLNYSLENLKNLVEKNPLLFNMNVIKGKK